LPLTAPAAPGPALWRGDSASQGASVVAGDDFYRDMPTAVRWALSPVQGAELYFDWERLRRSAIEPLRAGEDAEFRPFSWLPDGGLADHLRTVTAAPTILIEGSTQLVPSFPISSTSPC